jgi:hypothetical protein
MKSNCHELSARANFGFAFSSAFCPLQIGVEFGFSVRTELFFSVLPRFQALFCAIFRTEPVNWRLFFGFGLFSGSVRDALKLTHGFTVSLNF